MYAKRHSPVQDLEILILLVFRAIGFAGKPSREAAKGIESKFNAKIGPEEKRNA